MKQDILDVLPKRSLDRPMRLELHYPPWWLGVLLPSLAAGMAWGIRGQYGHETGAMIAGLLVSLSFAFLYRSDSDALPLARAIAWGTLAMGIGGSMTYGQTVGLTHDKELVGHSQALVWGFLGLSIKGAIWIGFAGFFMGLGFSGHRFRPIHMVSLMASIIVLYIIGVHLLNQPFDPSQKILPKLYFSDSWHWEPNADLKPRREIWGGLLLALLGAWTWVSFIHPIPLARNLTLWAMLGGAVGFPLGQSLQSYHAWHAADFQTGIWTNLGPHINWWNMMETTFGLTFGAILGHGFWLNRRSLKILENSDHPPDEPAWQWPLLLVHLTLLIGVEFGSHRLIDALYDLGLLMVFIPIVAVTGSRWWPYLIALPITLIPIAGKTVRQLVYQDETLNPLIGWFIFLIVPLSLTLAVAINYARMVKVRRNGFRFSKTCLILCTWIYFGLNFAFFHFPWPWLPWNGRTPNGLIFLFCATGITSIALIHRKPKYS